MTRIQPRGHRRPAAAIAVTAFGPTTVVRRWPDEPSDARCRRGLQSAEWHTTARRPGTRGATDGSPAPRGPRERGADAGLTLLEMLIVLAVIAVATGATALSLGPRRDGAPAATAQALAAAIGAAADRSIATGAPGVLVVDAGGYTLGGTRHPLTPGIVVGAPPAMTVAVDGAPFDVTVTDGRERWHVAFDGWRAVATRDAT